MVESTTVTVGLDVHAGSIRLAAVRADQVLGLDRMRDRHRLSKFCLRQWLRLPGQSEPRPPLTEKPW